MPGQTANQRTVKKTGRPRIAKREGDKDKAAAKALCTEIAMLAAAKGWGRKPSS
jgi:hypothetical protein